MTNKTQEELLSEIDRLRLRLEDAEETLRAIGSGEVDALIVSGANGEQQIFTLRGAEYPYRVLVETMNEGAATLAADGTILYCNNRLATLLQYPLESVIGTPLSAYVSPADQLLISALLGKRIAECDKDEIDLVTSKGNAVPVLISFCRLDLIENQGLSVVVTDLTQHKRNEEFLASAKLARSIIEQAGEVIVVCDESGRIINASLLAHRLGGKNPLLNSFDEVYQLRRAETGELVSVFQFMVRDTFRNVEVIHKQGEARVNHLILNATPLKSPSGKNLGCVVTLTDITKRKLAEERTKASLAEKEVLLKEIHHRVKNNLQVISSLISMQADNLTDQRTREEFSEVCDRVRSMALIHEKLYQTSDLAKLNFADYVTSLLEYLWDAHDALAGEVRLHLELAPVELSIESAVPFGLILNELVGNALKHAFPHRQGGEVTVGMEQDPATETVCLRVCDNGVGLPSALDWRQSRSLGLHLVQILAGQLQGTVETGTGPGTEFRVTFPLAKK